MHKKSWNYKFHRSVNHAIRKIVILCPMNICALYTIVFLHAIFYHHMYSPYKPSWPQSCLHNRNRVFIATIVPPWPQLWLYGYNCASMVTIVPPWPQLCLHIHNRTFMFTIVPSYLHLYLYTYICNFICTFDYLHNHIVPLWTQLCFHLYNCAFIHV